MCNDGLWLSAAASALSANVRCQVDEREDSESAERQQWVDSAHSSIAAAKVSLWAEKLPLDSSFSDSARQIRLQSSNLVYLNRAARFWPFAWLPIAALT